MQAALQHARNIKGKNCLLKFLSHVNLRDERGYWAPAHTQSTNFPLDAVLARDVTGGKTCLLLLLNF